METGSKNKKDAPDWGPNKGFAHANEGPPSSKFSAWTPLLQSLAILALCAWIYEPDFHGALFMDDAFYLTKNPLLNDPARVWKAWFDPGSWIEYYPLEETVQWVQWQLWSDQTLGYHLTNVALHGLNALLVWRLLAKFGLRWAWLGGLIFAVHPIAVESVVSIAELKNTLSLAPFLLAMGAWVDYERAGRRRDYAWALGLFLTAMLCKISMALFPLIILVYAWWKRGRIGWDDARASAPFFTVSLVLGLITIWTGIHYEKVNDLADSDIPLGGFASHLALGGLASSFYFSKVFLPVGLLPIYPQWLVDPPALWQFLPWPLLAMAIAWLWQKRRDWGRHVLLGLAFFLINLAPFVGFHQVSFMKFTWVMDHFLYLPMIGLLGLIVAGVEQVGKRWSGRGRICGLALIAVTLGLLACQSRDYAGKFVNGATLWTYTLERNPQAWPAYNDLGVAYFLEGRVTEAMSQYQIVLGMRPRFAEAHDNLGLALFQAARTSEAIEQFRQAVALKSGDATLRNNLAFALFQTGRVDEAIIQYEFVLQRRPRYAKAQKHLADALLQVGLNSEARDHYEEALRIQPNYPAARDSLARLQAQEESKASAP